MNVTTKKSSSIDIVPICYHHPIIAHLISTHDKRTRFRRHPYDIEVRLAEKATLNRAVQSAEAPMCKLM